MALELTEEQEAALTQWLNRLLLQVPALEAVKRAEAAYSEADARWRVEREADEIALSGAITDINLRYAPELNLKRQAVEDAKRAAEAITASAMSG